MKEPYLSVTGEAQAETDRAFCIKSAVYIVDGVSMEHSSDLWIPKANIMEDSLDDIEEVARGDRIEIFVAKWWLKEQ